MASINLYSDSQDSATRVSNVFIDEYMSNANGEFVKVYLYLLRQLHAPGSAFSISAIADKFEHTEKDIKRALSYWERMQLLRLEYDADENLTGVHLLDTQPKGDGGHEPPAAPAGDRTKQQAPAPQKKTYSADEIRQFREQEAAAELLFITERYLGRVLTPTDLNVIFYWYDEFQFSTDLIEYLIEYCVSKGHTSIHYIDKVALAWSKHQVKTVEQAKLAVNGHNQAYFTVMKSLGIKGRSFVPSETAYIDKWNNEYGFSAEMIAAACERTIQAIHQPSFEYVDTILNNWRKNHIATLEDAAKLDEAHQKKKKSASAPKASAKNKFNNFDQRSYDYDQLEKMLLTTSVR